MANFNSYGPLSGNIMQAIEAVYNERERDASIVRQMDASKLPGRVRTSGFNARSAPSSISDVQKGDFAGDLVVDSTYVYTLVDVPNTGLQWTRTGISWSSGGSFTPIVFYALGSGSANLSTSLSTIPLATASVSDVGYTLASNEITIGAELNGKRIMATWSVSGTGATSRVEIRSELQVNAVKVKGSSNYTARDANQNTGGVQGFHVFTASTGDVIRVQALRDGSTANLIADETHLFLQTIN